MRKSYQVECEHSVRFWFEYFRQRRNLRALAWICEFYPKLFLEVVIKRKSNSWDVRTFTIDCLKCHQVHTRSPQRKTMQDTVLGTAVWHEIFAGSNFCDFCGFSSDPQNMFLEIKITANIFPAKFFSRVNILSLKLATQKYGTKKSQLVKNNEILVYCLKISVFLLHVLNKNESIINAGYWVLSEDRKNWFPARKTNLSKSQKLVPSKQKKSPIRKHFVSHGILTGCRHAQTLPVPVDSVHFIQRICGSAEELVVHIFVSLV